MLNLRTTKLIAFVVCILILLAVLSLFEPIYGNICRYSEYTEHTRCTPNHILYVWLWYLGRFFDSISAFATATATVGLVVVTYLLVRLGQEQSITSRAQLRAYVMVKTATMHDVAGDRMPTAKIEITNFGQTPAYSVKVRMLIGFAKWPFDNMEWPPIEISDEKRDERPVGPSDGFTLAINYSKALNAHEVAAIYGGRWAMWVAGKISYRDAFDKHRETDFCFFTNKATGVGKMGAVGNRNRVT